VNSKIPETLLFRNVSIVIAAINETISLRKTVEIIYKTCEKNDLAEIIVAVSKKSTPECLQACQDLKQEAQVPFSILVQTRRYAGGAYQDAFEVSQGSHVIMMASDLETDPHSVASLIAASKERPGYVICTSRWQEQGKFGKGYNPAKFVLNYVFQKLMRLIFRVDLTDWTFGYRLFPRDVIQAIKWEELRHPFFLESILKPLRLDVPVWEISTSWAPREEGVSQNPFWRNFLYFKTVFRVLFSNKAAFLKEPSSSRQNIF
jgi:glycosyltransferase involved in cell wall biosynthesis